MDNNQSIGEPRINSIHIIEDSKEDFELCKRLLKKCSFRDYNIHHYQKYTDFKKVKKLDDDFVFIDLGLPDVSVDEVFDSIKTDLTKTPVVVFTGDSDSQKGVQALSSGAQDFLVKSEITKNQMERTILLSKTRKKMEIELELEKKKLVSQAKFVTLGEMSSNIAHEINNPMAIIIGFADRVAALLKKRSEDFSKELGFLEKVRRTGRHVVDVIKSLSTFSQDGTNYNFQEEYLYSILEDLENFVGLKAKKIDCELKINKANSSLIKLECKKSEILQVLCNIVNNAFDAIAEFDEKWVSVDVEQSSGNINFIIKDSGKGIDPKIQKELLKPFFTTKTSDQGTGLGLAISNKIIKNHFGKLTIRNDEVNTCFVVTLPKRQEHNLVVDPKFINGKIVIIEDEEDIAEIYRDWLGNNKNVSVAHSGIQGLNEYVTNDDYCTLIVDIDLPDIKGDKVIERVLRVTREVKMIRVIFCSSFLSEEVKEKFSEKKNIFFLNKPTTKESLNLLVYGQHKH